MYFLTIFNNFYWVIRLKYIPIITNTGGQVWRIIWKVLNATVRVNELIIIIVHNTAIKLLSEVWETR